MPDGDEEDEVADATGADMVAKLTRLAHGVRQAASRHTFAYLLSCCLTVRFWSV